MISVIVPTIRTAKEMANVLKEIRATVSPDTELILASSKESAATNRNIGLNKAKGEFIIMCDDDVYGYTDMWDTRLVDVLAETKASVVGARLLGLNGKPHPINYGSYELGVDYYQVRSMIKQGMFCRLKG